MKYESNKDVKILYMGTPAMSAPVLETLITNGFDVVGVVTQEDKPVGRKNILTPSPVKEVALKYSLPVFQPHRIRLDYEFAKAMDIDVIVTFAYGQIIPTGLLELPKVGCINLHGSLLPKYRGAAPIQRAIMAGEKETGITLMEMVDKMDAGCAYDVERVAIEEGDNYSSMCIKLAEAGKRIVLRDVLKYCNGELKGEEQDESLVTFANKIKPEDEKLPLDLSCRETICYINGLSEEPGAFLSLDGKKVKIFKANTFSNDIIGAVGDIIPNKKKLLLQLKDGIISLEDVQGEGKKRMDGISFKNGAHLEMGAKFC